MKNHFSSPHKPNWLFIGLYSTLVIIVGFIGISSNTRQVRTTVLAQENELSTIADSKVNQIVKWREERLTDAVSLQKNDLVAKIIKNLIENPTSQEMISANMNWMDAILEYKDYIAIYILDPAGNLLLQNNPGEHDIGEDTLASLDLVFRTHTVQFSEFYYMSHVDHVHLNVVIPIFDPDPLYKPLAAVVLLINPENFLYPLIQSWPTTSATAETLLVKKDNEDVLFLNTLRFAENTALKLRFPLTSVRLPAVMAVTGTTGIVEGLDYRGKKVFASLNPVPDSDWFMVAKIDREEVYAPLRNQGLKTGLVMGLILISAGIILQLVTRRQSEIQYRRLYESELARQDLSRKYDFLMENANDIINVFSENGDFLSANNRAVEAYGYSKEEFLKLNLRDIRVPEKDQDIAHVLTQIKQKGSDRFETIHRRKDGSQFPVETSTRYFEHDGKGVIQCIVRDITRQKEENEKILRSENALKKAQAVARVGSWLWHIPSNSIYWSDEMYRIFGIDKEEFTGNLADVMSTAIHPDDRAAVEASNRSVLELNTPVPLEYRVLLPDGEIHTVWAEAGELVLDKSGNPVEFSGIVQDITDKKAAEDEIRKRENLLSRIYDILPVGLEIADKEGNIIESNQAIREIWGIDVEVRQGEFEVFRGKRLPSGEVIAPEDWASTHSVREGVTIRDEIIEIEAHDGKTKMILNSSAPIMDDNGNIEGAVVINLEITKLLELESALRQKEKDYQLLFMHMTQAFALHEIILDESGKPVDYRFLDVNPAFERLTGLDARKVIGRTVKEVIPNIEQIWLESYGKVALSGESKTFESYSSELQKYFYTHAFSPRQGQFATIFSDVTERKMANDALKESEEKLRAFFDSRVVGTLFGHVGGGILSANDELLNMIGYTRGELEKGEIRWDKITPAEFLPLDYKAIEEAKKEGSCTPYEKQYIRKDGTPIWILVGFVLVGENRENSIAYILNIDKRKRLEEETKIINRQLSEKVEELQRWNVATLGRESRVIELKKEVNELLKKMGKPPAYPSVEDESNG